MMDIVILNPIFLKLAVEEIDDRLPSIKFKLLINVNELDYNISSTSTVWIDCEKFDNFIIQAKNKKNSVFEDMDKLFSIFLDFDNNFLYWSCEKESIDKNFVTLKGSKSMTDMELFSIYEIFSNFPKWW